MKLLRNESGFALPLALLVMVTTSAILVTAIKTTSSSGRTANLGKTAISAEALAEAGINNAMAVLANPSNYALNSQLLPSHTTTYNEGTVTWSGTLDPLTGYWTITSVGSVQNPTGPGFRTRRLTATTQVVPTLSQPLNTLAWNYIYSRQTGNTCDMTIGQTVSIASPLYVNGNLCLQNQAKVAKGPLVVGGSLTQTNQNSVGTGSTPVNSVVVGGTCSKGSTTQNPCLGTSAVNIFATTFTRTVPSIPAPNVDLDGWYLVANPGPYYPCTTSSGTPPVFDTGQGPLPGSAVPQQQPEQRDTVQSHPGELLQLQDGGGRALVERGHECPDDQGNGLHRRQRRDSERQHQLLQRLRDDLPLGHAAGQELEHVRREDRQWVDVHRQRLELKLHHARLRRERKRRHGRRSRAGRRIERGRGRQRLPPGCGLRDERNRHRDHLAGRWAARRQHRQGRAVDVVLVAGLHDRPGRNAR